MREIWEQNWKWIERLGLPRLPDLTCATHVKVAMSEKARPLHSLHISKLLEALGLIGRILAS